MSVLYMWDAAAWAWACVAGLGGAQRLLEGSEPCISSPHPTPLCKIWKSVAFLNQEIPVEMLSFFQKASSQPRGRKGCCGCNHC